MFRSEKGASSFEYAVLLGIAGAAAMGAVFGAGPKIARVYNEASVWIDQVKAPQSNPGDTNVGASDPSGSKDTSTDCGRWRDLKWGYVKDGSSVEIVVRGNVIGRSDKVKVNNKTGAVSVHGMAAYGSAESLFLLTVEHRSSSDHFDSSDRISVYSSDGLHRLVNRSQIRLDKSPWYEGDDYVIAFTHDILVNIGLLPAVPENVVYDGSDINGDPNLGNNDGSLQFADVGCVLPPPGGDQHHEDDQGHSHDQGEHDDSQGDGHSGHSHNGGSAGEGENSDHSHDGSDSHAGDDGDKGSQDHANHQGEGDHSSSQDQGGCGNDANDGEKSDSHGEDHGSGHHKDHHAGHVDHEDD